MSDYARTYALRFGPRHLQQAKQWSELQTLLTDLSFLEAKVTAGMAFELAEDFRMAVVSFPSDRPQRRILRLLEEALRRDIHFIARHAKNYPQGLFQCLWNTCWWYDCEQAAVYYVVPDRGWNANSAPWMRPADQRLCRLLERWRELKQRTSPGFLWLRAHRPPTVHIGSPQRAVLRGHEDYVLSVRYSPDGRRIASSSKDGTVRVWDIESGAALAVLRGHEDLVVSVAYSPDGRRIASSSWDGTILSRGAQNRQSSGA